MLHYVGPRKEKKAIVPYFAFFEQEGDKTWSFAYFDLGDKKVRSLKGLTPKELWSYITGYGTPSLWYSYDLPWFVPALISEVVDTSWIEERILTPKGKDVEKFSLISKGGQDVVRMVIRKEKERKRSERKGDITLANMGLFYKEGPEALGKNFGLPFGIPLVDRLYGTLRVHEFITEKLKVTPRVSLAGAALACLQTFFIESKIPKIPKEIEDFIKPAFFGGMTEVYKIYDEHSWGYDMNGLYAEAYLNPLPIKAPYIKEDLTTEEFMETKDLGFVDVDIHIPEDLNKPTLPTHGPNGILRVVGSLQSTKEYPIRFFSEELKAAVRKNKATINKIHYGVFFKTSNPLLEKWASFTNRLKDEAPTPGEKLLAKNAQNAIYGKFAQKQERQVTHLGLIPEDRRKDPNITIIDDNTPIWFEDIEVRLSNNLPHIAAAVTAWARIRMANDSDRLEREGISISYHDTDAYHTNRPFPLDMVGELSGRYGCEYEDCEALHLAQKVYIISKDKKIVRKKVKGVPSHLITTEMLEAFTHSGDSQTVEWETPQTLSEAIVEKFLYSESKDKFQTVLENRTKKMTRNIPGGLRYVSDILEMDTRRKQLSLTESRPLKAEEVFPCRR